MADDGIALTFDEAIEVLYAFDLGIDVINGLEELDERILVLNEVYDRIKTRLRP